MKHLQYFSLYLWCCRKSSRRGSSCVASDLFGELNCVHTVHPEDD